jgi:hypothetical protein
MAPNSFRNSRASRRVLMTGISRPLQKKLKLSLLEATIFSDDGDVICSTTGCVSQALFQEKKQGMNVVGLRDPVCHLSMRPGISFRSGWPCHLCGCSCPCHFVDRLVVTSFGGPLLAPRPFTSVVDDENEVSAGADSLTNVPIINRFRAVKNWSIF